MLLPWSKRSSSVRSSSSTQRTGRRRLGMEMLESRLMMVADFPANDFGSLPADPVHVDAYTVGDTLYVNGGDTNDGIAVDLSPGGTTLRVKEYINGSYSTVFTFGSNLINQIEVRGFGGHDTIQISTDVQQDSLIFGQDGNDYLFAGGNTMAYGNAGDDVLVGSSGLSSLFGDGDNDTFFAGSGITSMHGGSGHDEMTAHQTGFSILQGDSGNDTFFAKGGTTAFWGGGGNDTLSYEAWVSDVTIKVNGNYESGKTYDTKNHLVNADIEIFKGGGGDDYFVGSNNGEQFYGGNGNDEAFGGGGNDLLVGGNGVDILHGEGGNDAIVGNEDNDFLYGGSGNDTILGMQGHDWIWGQSGNDVVYGDEGVDTIEGGSGEDELHGGDHQDFIDGGSQDDEIYGDGGPDILHGDGGNDSIWGGDSGDEVYGDTGHDILFGGDYNDLLVGGSGDDYLNGGLHHDTLEGGSGEDTLVGGGGHDEMWGGDDDDDMWGGTGDDDMFGGDGNDYLHGQWGADYIEGGLGVDIHIGGPNIDEFNSVDESSSDMIIAGDFDFYGWGDVATIDRVIAGGGSFADVFVGDFAIVNTVISYGGAPRSASPYTLGNLATGQAAGAFRPIEVRPTNTGQRIGRNSRLRGGTEDAPLELQRDKNVERSSAVLDEYDRALANGQAADAILPYVSDIAQLADDLAEINETAGKFQPYPQVPLGWRKVSLD